MKIHQLYDAIMELQDQLSAQHHDAEIGCLDYKVIKALAATYELQDYLAARIACECPDEPKNIQIDELMKLSTEELEYIIQIDLDYGGYDSETIENVTRILASRSGVSEDTRRNNADASWERFKEANSQFFCCTVQD